jgi:hypothetical protein
VDERLPEEYEKCLVGLTSILKEAWTTSQQTENKREKIQDLSLAKDLMMLSNLYLNIVIITATRNKKTIRLDLMNPVPKQPL